MDWKEFWIAAVLLQSIAILPLAMLLHEWRGKMLFSWLEKKELGRDDVAMNCGAELQTLLNDLDTVTLNRMGKVKSSSAKKQ